MNTTVPADIPCQVLTQLIAAGITPEEIAARAEVPLHYLSTISPSGHILQRYADGLYRLQAEVETERPDLAAKWSLDTEIGTR